MFHILTSNSLPYEIPLYGEVEKIFTTYGFVSTYDSKRYFFHFGTCASKPELLKVGDVVEFVLGEDIKTHRLHAQKVRKINPSTMTPTPPPTAAAILNTLPTAAVFVSTQALLTVTAAGLIPLPYPSQTSSSSARIAFTHMNNMLTNTSSPSTSSTSPPSTTITSSQASVSKYVAQTNINVNENNTKRKPLRQIAVPQQNQQPIAASRGDADGANWDAVLFKPFAVGPSSNNDREENRTDMASAYERARFAWFSVKQQ